MSIAIYLDTNIFVSLFEGEGSGNNALWEFIKKGVETPDVTFSTSSFSFTELLVKPYRERDNVLARQYLLLAKSGDWLKICEAEPAVIDAAAIVRARLGLKLPDAIHLATAVVNACNYFLTFDAGIPSIEVLEHPISGKPINIPIKVIRPDPTSLSQFAKALS